MITIRPATPDDFKTIQKLNSEVFEDSALYDNDLIMDWPFRKAGKNYLKSLLSDSKQCCFIAEDNGQSVGYIAAAPLELTYRKTPYCEIENMGVTPEYRSKGIGSLLIKACERWAREKGYKKMYVNTYWESKKAQKFYKKNGFREKDIVLTLDL